MRRNSATAVGSQVTTATGPVSPPSIQQISHVGKKSLPSPPLRVCCCKPAFSIHLGSGSRLQKPDGFCIPSAALRHYSCEGLPLALITCFAAVRWLRCKRSNRNKSDGAMGLRRAHTDFDRLVSHWYYGVCYGNTLKRLLLVQFLLVRIKITES